MTILAPIQRHIDALAEPGYPAEAVRACVARPEASVPLLRALLQRAARGQPLSDPDANRLFIGLHVLAKLRDTQSFVPLMRLLGRPFDDVEELLGDVVTATLGRVAASLFDGDADILFEMIADTALDEYIRDALWGAATTLVIQRRIDRERMRAFILRFEEEHLAPSGDVAWFGWLGAISYAGFADVAAGIGRFWSDGRLSRDIITLKEFHQNLAEALAAPDDPARLARVGLAPIDDIAQALSWVDWNGPPEPIINPMRGVGRNDPCPCGSGKKAKKCCLQLKS